MLPHPLEIFKIDSFNKMNMYSQIFKSYPPPPKKKSTTNKTENKSKIMILQARKKNNVLMYIH